MYKCRYRFLYISNEDVIEVGGMNQCMNEDLFSEYPKKVNTKICN